ncbi:FAD-dependent oxidoreductase [Kitasatospora phosalacinea]|uniref:D-amino-acid oxidase n=1 Tax=Kitasatospora phosalacinea TaxID=2065 RepID=A0A9W6PAD3_9ACTN|nr:FAD-dependent oxidoreductase [Kitasatospora phosalacinea]GLW52014.1 amino acid oxidase [Kitasatospora phosalacinea]
MTAPVTVVGGGVTGLTTALELQDRGRAVTLLTPELPHHTTSVVAAAIWHPFFQRPDPLYLRRATTALHRLTALAADPAASGVRVRTLTEFFPAATEAPWWTRELPERHRARPADCPPGYASAWAVPVPVADAARYLAHLAERFAARGGRIEHRQVSDLAAEVARTGGVVNCTGYGSAALAGDRSLSLVRGVVLRCAKPEGLHGCWIDDGDPRRPTYVVEREHDAVLGGTADPGLVATAVPDETVADILARCARLVPAVADARVLEVRVGFRPARGTVRVERDPYIPGLVHNYGHGGAGFTLSWGCATDAADLLGTTH